MPEFDTYGAIKRYAQAPDDFAAKQAYQWLKRSTYYALRWDASARTSGANVPAAIVYRIGANLKQSAKAYLNLPAMSENARKDAYLDICKSVGLNIDPSIFNKDQT